MISVAVERLPGLIGHELRNPLASAITGAMLARDLVDSDDPRAQVLDGVLRDLDRMTGLLDGWLAMARDQEPAQGLVDLEDLLRSVAARHRAQLVVCPPAVAIRGNRMLLERAFDNLCENARHAGATTVRLAAQHDGSKVAVHVEDDGSGVSPEQLPHLFEPGWSCRGSTGLGLHAVAATVASCDGDVRCVPLARGTRFTMTLPLAEACGA